MKQVTIQIRDEDYEALKTLAKRAFGVPDAVQNLLEFTAKLFAEGTRRPGSWEAAAVAAMFGE